jgi:hypothetical protein
LLLLIGNTSKDVAWKPIHALKMKHVWKALVYGQCLVVFNDLGTTGGAVKVPTLALIPFFIPAVSNCIAYFPTPKYTPKQLKTVVY